MSSSTPGPSGGGSANTVTPAAAAAPRKQTPSAPGKLAVSEQLITVTSLVEVLAPLVCAGVNITDATKIGVILGPTWHHVSIHDGSYATDWIS